MRFLVFLWVMAIATPAYAAWNEPDSFMGLKFNFDLEYQLLPCEERTFRGDTTRPPCWRKLASGYVLERAPKIADTEIFLTAYQADKKLGAIRGSFPTSRFQTIAGVFTERYGPPTAMTEPQWMSKGGVKLQNAIFEWKGNIVSVQLRKLASKIDESDFTVMTSSYKAASRAQDAEKIKDAAKGL